MPYFLKVYIYLPKQSIYFRLTDDQGSADVKYANPNLPFSTDNIDKLASNSIRFVSYA